MARTEDERRLINEFYKNGPRISEQLPRLLPGGSVVHTLSLKCADCRRSIRGYDCRGHVKESSHGLSVTAFGYCISCNLLTPMMVDVVDGGDDFIVRTRKNFVWRAGEVVPLRGFTSGED